MSPNRSPSFHPPAWKIHRRQVSARPRWGCSPPSPTRRTAPTPCAPRPPAPAPVRSSGGKPPHLVFARRTLSTTAPTASTLPTCLVSLPHTDAAAAHHAPAEAPCVPAAPPLASIASAAGPAAVLRNCLTPIPALPRRTWTHTQNGATGGCRARCRRQQQRRLGWRLLHPHPERSDGVVAGRPGRALRHHGVAQQVVLQLGPDARALRGEKKVRPPRRWPSCPRSSTTGLREVGAGEGAWGREGSARLAALQVG